MVLILWEIKTRASIVRLSKVRQNFQPKSTFKAHVLSYLMPSSTRMHVLELHRVKNLSALPFTS